MDASRTLTDAAFAVARDAGCEAVGFAPVERFRNGPEGYRPQDYLSGATGVISMGMRIPDGVCDVWGDHAIPGRSIGPYLFYGYGYTNLELSRAAVNTVKWLEGAGYACRVFPPTWSVALYRWMGSKEGEFSADLSQRHAAVAAGNAEFGWNGLALHPRFGARMRWNAVITDAPLEPDPLYSGPAVCRPDRCGYKCVKVCPTGALTSEGARARRVVMGEREWRYAPIDPVRCLYGIWGLAEGSGSYRWVDIPEGPGDREHLLRCLREQHPDDAQMREPSPGIISGDYCGRCLHQCPAHRWSSGED
jgi:hypothetical protein